MHKPKGGNMPDDDKKTNDDVKNDDVVDDVNDDTASDDTSKDDDADVLSDKEKKAIGESKKYQKRAQKAEKELDKIREEKLSADEKKDLKIKQLQDDKLEADRKLRDSNLDSLILNYASTLGFQDLDVVKLIALKELDDEDEVTKEDVEAVIDSIAKDKAYLLGGSDTTDVGKGNFKGGTKIDEEKNPDEMLREAMLK